jgi:hypothetical protein
MYHKVFVVVHRCLHAVLSGAPASTPYRSLMCGAPSQSFRWSMHLQVARLLQPRRQPHFLTGRCRCSLCIVSLCVHGKLFGPSATKHEDPRCAHVVAAALRLDLRKQPPESTTLEHHTELHMSKCQPLQRENTRPKIRHRLRGTACIQCTE